METWKTFVVVVSVVGVVGILVNLLACDPTVVGWKISESKHQQQRMFVENGDITTPTSCCEKTNGQTFVVCENLPFTSTRCGEKEAHSNFLVPNTVHYVWYGDMEMKYYHYLSIRSAAANQKPEEIMFHINGSEPRGVWWERVKEEIPCLRLVLGEAPESIFGNAISHVLHQTDLMRLLVLLKYGGIYLDSDAIVLRSLNSLRKFPFTIGRSTEFSLSNSVMLAEPNSTFLREWLSFYTKFNSNKFQGIHLADFGVKLPLRMILMRKDSDVHVEEVSLQRPNPWSEGRACISHGSFNISHNYVLHLHPQKSLKRDPTVLLDYRAEELRLYDTTYGAGARAALFGTQDLIFFKSEISIARNRKPAEPIMPYPNINQYMLV